MNQSPVLAELDQLIASRSILQHPFYQAWSAGALTREQLATYASYYYPHVAAFPGYLEAAIETTTDEAIRAELLDNLREELAEPQPHAELWLAFAEACGVHASTVEAAPVAVRAAATVEAFNQLTSTSPAAALTALYAYESQQPEVAHTKAEGLRSFYGITSEEGLSYFTVHAEADIRHREGERQALARCLDQGASREEVLGAAEKALDAYWRLLDGVCEQADIPCMN